MGSKSNGIANGHPAATPRSGEIRELLQTCVDEIVPFFEKADSERELHQSGGPVRGTTALANPSADTPDTLRAAIGTGFELSEDGVGLGGLRQIINDILTYSVNPSAPGFLDKLYAAPLPPGIAADLLLSVLNTNVHVYQVSPVLTLVEKEVTKSLAQMFGLNGPRSGGINVQGGSASNLTSIAIARNTIFPETKKYGNRAVKEELVMFTSAHGHYSIEKAAQALGFGSSSVIAVPVDEAGRMIPAELERLVNQAKVEGQRPFYVNATAGSTVLGSFDPFVEISKIAKKHGLWFHIDGAWGGSFIFSSRKETKEQLRGTEEADSIAMNPHKMLGVPVTCSFLLGKDLRQFQAANTLKAGYLFHNADGNSSDRSDEDKADFVNGISDERSESHRTEPYDLADLTLQCGRRGDSLKFFLSWQCYGTQGYSKKVDQAYDVACRLSQTVDIHPDLLPVLATGSRPSCLQVCFYFAPEGKFAYGLADQVGHIDDTQQRTKLSGGEAAARNRDHLGRLNSKVTAKITKALIPKGFMIDFAPALDGQEDKGSFFRVVVNISTIQETVDRLITDLVDVGRSVLRQIEQDEGYKANGV